MILGLTGILGTLFSNCVIFIFEGITFLTKLWKSFWASLILNGFVMPGWRTIRYFLTKTIPLYWVLMTKYFWPFSSLTSVLKVRSLSRRTAWLLTWTDSTPCKA